MTEPATIFALSSAPGRAGVAVLRISGPNAGDIADRMASPRPDNRYAALRRVRDPDTGEILDEALLLWMAGPRTETGEDMLELHLHGSPAVVRAVLDALSRQPGCRLAEPGEFTIRAFRNGKMDLAQVEGFADLIDAETEAQRRQALAQARGGLSKLYEGWRRDLIEASALAEAAIDFSDEGDVADDAFSRARAVVGRVLPAIAAHLDDNHRGEILREGFRVVLAGPPNAGKSSLLNTLAQRDAAIVSDEAGTTRDAIEVRLDLDGIPIILTDTAGIREPAGTIEREGIRRTISHAREADLVLWLSDSTQPDTPIPPEMLERGENYFLRLASKIDIPGNRHCAGALSVSARTGAGVPELIAAIAARARERTADAASAPAITRTRYREQLTRCMNALQTFMHGRADEHELRAEDLRHAVLALGRITGRVDVEDVLGEIFGRFCIGK